VLDLLVCQPPCVRCRRSSSKEYECICVRVGRVGVVGELVVTVRWLNCVVFDLINTFMCVSVLCLLAFVLFGIVCVELSHIL
jgi:hypothetical protein